jgi:hypothetical protein
MGMAAKARSMKKRAKPSLPEISARFRCQHTPLTRDVLTAAGLPIVARLRTRTILTPLAVRLTIIEEAAAKSDTVRVRSLRRRLTPLDRALSDCEAEMLERLTSCIISLSNISCIDLSKPVARLAAAGRLPFGEHKRREISAMTFVLRGLSAAHKSAVLELAVLLDPSTSLQGSKPGEVFIASVCQAAGAATSLYQAWERQERQACARNGELPLRRMRDG